MYDNDDGHDKAFAFQPGPLGQQIGRFAALDAIPQMAHAVTTSQSFDDQRVKNDPAWTANALATTLALDGVAYCKQVHGNTVLTVDSPGPAGQADGLVTRTGGLGIMGFSADCPILLAVNSQARVVGMAHASWRGTTAGIATRVIEAMVNLGAAEDGIVACLCPSAGPCCYEVGPDVRDAATAKLGSDAARFFLPHGQKWLLDLWSANVSQLTAANVPESHIHIAGVCTICSHAPLPSYRLSGNQAGRFACALGFQNGR